jgi:hypothetical protein
MRSFCQTKRPEIYRARSVAMRSIFESPYSIHIAYRRSPKQLSDMTRTVFLVWMKHGRSAFTKARPDWLADKVLVSQGVFQKRIAILYSRPLPDASGCSRFRHPLSLILLASPSSERSIFAPQALSPKRTSLRLPYASWLAVFPGLCYSPAFALASRLERFRFAGQGLASRGGSRGQSYNKKDDQVISTCRYWTR